MELYSSVASVAPMILEALFQSPGRYKARMHGPLDEHLHTEECNVIIRELQRCHQVLHSARKKTKCYSSAILRAQTNFIPGEQHVQTVFRGLQST